MITQPVAMCQWTGAPSETACPIRQGLGAMFSRLIVIALIGLDIIGLGQHQGATSGPGHSSQGTTPIVPRPQTKPSNSLCLCFLRRFLERESTFSMSTGT